MTIFGELDDGASPAIKKAAPGGVGIVYEIFGAVACPVNGQTHGAKGIGFTAVVDVAIGIVEVQNALIAPKINGNNLQAGQVCSEFSQSRILAVAYPVVFENVSI